MRWEEEKRKRGRERCKRGRYTKAREKNPKKKKVKCAHTSKDGGDRTAPSIEGYISRPNGEDKRDKDGEGTTESTVKGVNRVVGGQGNPAPFITPRPYRIPRRGPFLTQSLIHHYPIPPSRTLFCSHVHISLETLPQLLPRRISQSSCQSHPRWYRQVIHLVRRKFGRGYVPLS